jgi:phage FluMu gp28-like protein
MVAAISAVQRTRAKYRALYAPAPPTPLDWAYSYGIIRTADGTTHRYADVPRAYQDRILADPSSRVIIAKSRQIGISQTVAFLAACEAEAGGTVLWLSRTGDQAGEALRYVYTALSERNPQYQTENRYSLVLANGGRVITQPATRGAGRGIPATLVIVDEQAWQEYAREVYTAVLPTLATTNGRLIVLSTPNGRGNLFAELWRGPHEIAGQLR